MFHRFHCNTSRANHSWLNEVSLIAKPVFSPEHFVITGVCRIFFVWPSFHGRTGKTTFKNLTTSKTHSSLTTSNTHACLSGILSPVNPRALRKQFKGSTAHRHQVLRCSAVRSFFPHHLDDHRWLDGSFRSPSHAHRGRHLLASLTICLDLGNLPFLQTTPSLAQEPRNALSSFSLPASSFAVPFFFAFLYPAVPGEPRVNTTTLNRPRPQVLKAL